MKLKQLADDEVLAGHGRCFPVMAGQELLGLITLSDLRKVDREEWAETTVFRAMTPFSQLRKAETNDDLPAVMRLMASGDINQVPLVEGNLLVGLINLRRSERFRALLKSLTEAEARAAAKAG